MNTWRWTAPLRDAVFDSLEGEPWDEEYKAEVQESLATIPEDAVIADEHGARDANGDVVELDEEPVDDHPPHPVTLIEYFGLRHLAELEVTL